MGYLKVLDVSFNTQPPKGGWAKHRHLYAFFISVSTHSRLKAAGIWPTWSAAIKELFQHTAA